MKTDTAVDIWIPDGYLELPLSDIEQKTGRAATLFDTLPPSSLKSGFQAIVPAVTALLTQLAQRDTRYCGIGRFLSSSGAVVTSCLTVCVYETGGEKLNPRLILKNLVESRVSADESTGQVELLEVDGRPVLFTEQTTELPTPELPGLPYAGTTTSTYQLEAVVPYSDGSALAAIELSTPAIEAGPEFRKMIADMARSITFRQELPPSTSTLDI
ncbi:hypothetical protein [Nocardia pseudobrasiliensis]|uniref:Uncharacterized protein n=1 Tax=Nocardia pseudobrasiliensis TaxID=45979 RepID=A0A370I2Q1_9NOCA|nr:hypothetical protein [Nocardia pseudobrasiliensis]RDI64441.1 hypothetical protein DFR76_108274 [Nocardia pseudobrasiliensis]